MKKPILQLALTLCLLICLTACADKANGGFIKGKVEKIENGKDGYTVEIRTDEDSLVYGTISIPNMENPHDYRRVKIGETIQIKGEIWRQNHEKHVVVHQLKE